MGIFPPEPALALSVHLTPEAGGEIEENNHLGHWLQMCWLFAWRFAWPYSSSDGLGGSDGSVLHGLDGHALYSISFFLVRIMMRQ